MAQKHQKWPYSLRALELFADCSNAELTQISSLVTMLTVEPGRVLMSEGTIGMEFMVIADGEAEVTVAGAPRARLRPGDFAGEMSLLAHDRRSATVTALTPVTFYVCNTAEFSSLLDVAPSVAAKITDAAARRAEANRSERLQAA
jgi:CRP-like cAMP-binding protein